MEVSTTKIILASGSPRRKELLSDLGYQFDIIIPNLDESLLPRENPSEHVLRLSLAKARAIAMEHSDDIIIGADTIVVLGDKILGKPASPDEAVSMLKLLSGKPHIVYTGLTLMILNENIIKSDYDATKVVFNDLEESAIEKYVASGEPLDKAGAYGIQGMGSFLVNHY
ncbi:MAG TPA: septum formation protein Maf, partial [candidate division Zixibacteria bacterium]|nr:septum formation protein Maf [candidate division Zixibacteria bacterium]